ncbi:MAG: hypothetical protein WC356_05070 [Candidatus Micrarchaeia archaeon]
MLKKITRARAYSLAETHQPIAWQGFRSYWDWPAEINLEGNPNFLALDQITKGPVAYYWCRTDGTDYYYIGYAFYHNVDWANFPGNIVPGEVHRHDLEGVLCRVPYYLPHCKPKEGYEVITVCHHQLDHFRYSEGHRPYVSIEYGGHGIRPCTMPYYQATKTENGLGITDWRLLPFDPIMADAKRREIIRQNFNNSGVNLPDQWSSNGQYKGLFWSKPDELFKEMMK